MRRRVVKAGGAEFQSPKRNEKAKVRLPTLAWDRRQVRGLLARNLEEYGALERTERPAQKAPPQPPSDGWRDPRL